MQLRSFNRSINRMTNKQKEPGTHFQLSAWLIILMLKAMMSILYFKPITLSFGNNSIYVILDCSYVFSISIK